ncbi:MAG: hypothetical protein WCP12_02770 [bacterium]
MGMRLSASAWLTIAIGFPGRGASTRLAWTIPVSRGPTRIVCSRIAGTIRTLWGTRRTRRPPTTLTIRVMFLTRAFTLVMGNSATAMGGTSGFRLLWRRFFGRDFSQYLVS